MFVENNRVSINNVMIYGIDFYSFKSRCENDNTIFSDFIDNNELQTRVSNKM